MELTRIAVLANLSMALAGSLRFHLRGQKGLFPQH
jgi:hypothetical protein